jgi:prolyl oligopeptidase
MRRFKSLKTTFLVALLTILVSAGCAVDTGRAPVTAKSPASDIYHQVEVIDNYRWLEDKDDPAVMTWTDAQNEYSRDYLDQIPVRSAIAARMNQLYDKASPGYKKFHLEAGRLFAMKDDPTKDQPMLVSMASPTELETEQIIVNPNELDSTGQTAIDFFVVSPGARLVAVSLSKGGSEDGDVYVFDVETGETLSDMVPRVNGPTAGGDVAWSADGSGFYYTRYPRQGERPPSELRFFQQVYFHKLGSSTEDDSYTIGANFPDIAEIEFETSRDNRYIVAAVANGDGGEFAHYLRGLDGDWTRITKESDLIPILTFAPDNSLYFLSHQGSPRGKIMQLAEGQSDISNASQIVAQSDAVIDNFCITESMLFVNEVIGGPSQIRVLDRQGRFQKQVPILPVSAVYGMTWLGGDQLLFRNQSCTEPEACYLFEPAEGRVVKTAMQASSPADFSDVEVVREFATSKDGTQVPINIIRRKGMVLDGNNPTILYGYGSYGSIGRPYYDRRISLWLDNGGIYVRTNIRGGGEFGEDWHHAGSLTNKQNTYDDFAACAQYLIDKKYTNSDRLAIRGGSAGGLMVAAVMTQHPELFKAVVCQRGVLDALRVEFDPNGAFNVTEFGTVTIEDQFRALHAYSPYHSVVDGTNYPDILFTADENDGRVLSYHSKKTAAAMQAASPGSLTLLTVTTGRGHGQGSSLTADNAMYADLYAFLFDRLGVKFETP